MVDCENVSKKNLYCAINAARNLKTKIIWNKNWTIFLSNGLPDYSYAASDTGSGSTGANRQHSNSASQL